MYPANRKQTKSHGGKRSLASDAKSRFGRRERCDGVMGKVMLPTERSIVFMRARIGGGVNAICT